MSTATTYGERNIPAHRQLPFGHIHAGQALQDGMGTGAAADGAHEVGEDTAGPVSILIVDDDESFGRMLVNAISRLTGYDCSYAQGAIKALQMLEEKVADVVITDIRMPDMNGLELTSFIKAKYASEVIAITGYYENYSYEDAIVHGADDFVEKPVKPSELVIRLKRVLRERDSLFQRRQAEEKLRQLNLELERRVEERNAELIKFNELLRKEIKERRKMEEELREREVELKNHALQLEKANAELESFSYSVSHDLREPLRAIEGFSLMLVKDLQGRIDEAAGRKLAVIREKVRKMDQLIEDILHFHRLGRQALDTSFLDMESLATKLWKECLENHPEREIAIRISPLPVCRGDQKLISQVLANLLANAVKFTKGTAEALVEIGGYENRDEWVYYVKDNGIGFDMHYYDKLFHLFRRLHNEEEFAGTGVGLSIVKRIIERHGGRVWAEGKVAEGAAFYFSLPKQEV